MAAADALKLRLRPEPLADWIDRFTVALQAGAQTAFYRALAEVTAGLLRAEIQVPDTH